MASPTAATRATAGTPTPGEAVPDLYLPLAANGADLNEALDPQEYAVLRAIIVERFDHTAFERLVIEDHTDTWGLGSDGSGAMRRRLAARWPELDRQAIDQLLARNAISQPLTDRFDLDTEVILITAAEVEEIFDSGGWDEFYRRYPGAPGIMMLSRVGFSPDGKWAVAYMGNQYHYLAGSGWVFLLEKLAGEWTVVDGIMLWIS